MKSNKHKRLEKIAIRWLYGRGCSIFANEVPTWSGIADALGIITRDNKHTTYYIEAKASRSDLICAKQKKIYKWTENNHNDVFIKWNDIDFFYLIVADGVKVESDLYPLWGVINENGEVIRRAKRMKKGKDDKDLIVAVAHVLVYKVFGKMYE